MAICQSVFGAVHFLSLEIDIEDPFLKKINLDLIRSVFIQNQARLSYLLPDYKGDAFYVQNAPPMPNRIDGLNRKDFVWAGTMMERFGIMECLRFFRKYPQYHLVLKGGADNATLNIVALSVKLLSSKFL